nr:L [African bat icavirus PREDICT-06105] [mischivirus C1]
MIIQITTHYSIGLYNTITMASQDIFYDAVTEQPKPKAPTLELAAETVTDVTCDACCFSMHRVARRYPNPGERPEVPSLLKRVKRMVWQ